MRSQLNIEVIEFMHMSSYLVSKLEEVDSNFKLKMVADPNESYPNTNLYKSKITTLRLQYFSIDHINRNQFLIPEFSFDQTPTRSISLQDSC